VRFLPLVVLTACDAPHGKHRQPPEPACAEGYIADGEVCVPESCGAGPWGDLPVDGATVYVDAAEAEGGDGSAEAPLRTIQPALDLAGDRGGGLVAVAAGTYPETLTLTSDHAGVHLAGRCRELVTLDASVGDSQTPGIDIDSRYGEVEVSGLGVVGARYTGVLVRSGVVRLVELGVGENAFVGIGAYRGASPAPTRLEVEGCEVAGNASCGILCQDEGTEVTLVDTVVRDTQPDGNGKYGQGIEVSGGATLAAEGCVVAGNMGLGIAAIHGGTEVALVDTVVRDTLDRGDGRSGVGIAAQSGATLAVQGCKVVGNASSGIVAENTGTQVALVDTAVLDTRSWGEALAGFGFYVLDGAALSSDGCVVARNVTAGIEATDPGTRVDLVDTVVRDTLPGGEGECGRGIEVTGGATLTAVGCEILGNTGMGILVYDPGTQVQLLDTVVGDTQLESDGDDGFGIEVRGGAALAATNCDVARNTTLGIAAAESGTEVALVDTMVRDTLPRADGLGGHGIEVSGGATLSVEGCDVVGNTAAGIVAMELGTRVALATSVISGTVPGFGELAMTAMGLVAQQGASVSATDVMAQDNEGPGLYSSLGAQLSCTGCRLRGNQVAGAVVVDGGLLEIEHSEIAGTLPGVNLDGGVGIFAAQQWDWEPPSLVVTDSAISDNLVAGAWLAGAGSYQLTGSHVTGTTAVPHGATTRCGDGVYARDVVAWDGISGLWLSGNTLAANQGAGLFLDEAHALLVDNAWTGNDPDLWVQGDACLSPLDGYYETPEYEICPEWDQPACDLLFSLNLMVADADFGQARPPPAPPVLQLLPLRPVHSMPPLRQGFDRP
jgi:hypothetical protein